MPSINELESSSPRLEKLASQVKSGEIKLPKFQRPFVWKRSDILKLMDSIYKGYPIGSLLLWYTNEDLASERNIADLHIDQRSKNFPTLYLLDGQQRLSTVCGALYWKGNDIKSFWNIWFDLEEEAFFHPKYKDERKDSHFPLNKLMGTLEFYEEIRRLESSSNRERLAENASNLVKAFKDYQVPVATIGDMSIDEVAPIFERINSTGRQLTIVDLTRAATWKEGEFDLNNTIAAVKQALEPKNFSEIKESTILRSVAASSGLGINDDDIDKLRSLEPLRLRNSAKKSIESFQLAVDFLTSNLPLPSIAYLPYGLQLNGLSVFFDICKNPDISQRKELIKWFWKTSFSNYFRGYNTAQVSRDVQGLRDFAVNEIKSLNIDKEIDFDSFCDDKFSLRSATSKSFALLLAQNSPKNLLDANPVDIKRALSLVNKHEYHHIFPKAFLRSSGYPKEQIESRANIAILTLYGNRKISDKKPSFYFGFAKEKLGSSFKQVLESHYINEAAYKAILEDDYSTFLSERKKYIVQAMKTLIGSSVTETDSTPEQTVSNSPSSQTTSKTLKSIKYDEYDSPEEDETIQLDFF